MRRRIPAARNGEPAFTLVELLVVIAIIGILAALILSALGPAKTGAKKKLCQIEEGNLVAAINSYYAQYARLPASSLAVQAAAGTPLNSNDFTFGTVTNGGGQMLNLPAIQTSGSLYQNFNSEVISILRDDNFFLESSNGVQHIYNPQQTPLFTAKIASDTNSTGIGPDNVFRDLWGSPYIITMDLNYDNKCYDATLDAMYVLEGNTPLHLMVPGKAIVWSLGPLKTINLSQALNAGVNKQIIVTSF